MKFLFNKFKAFFLVSTISIFLTSITIFTFGNVTSTKDTIGEGKNIYVQEQHTPMMSEPTTVKQNQSVQVNPELFLLSRKDVVYVDSIVKEYLKRMEINTFNEKERLKENSKKEAIAYLFITIAALLLSSMGLSIGNRLENNSLIYLSVLTFGISFCFFLLKIPLLLI